MQVTNPPPKPDVVTDTRYWNAGTKRALGVPMDRALMHVQSQCVTQNGRGLFEYDNDKDLFVLSMKVMPADIEKCPYLQNVDEVWIVTSKVPYQELMEKS